MEGPLKGRMLFVCGLSAFLFGAIGCQQGGQVAGPVERAPARTVEGFVSEEADRAFAATGSFENWIGVRRFNCTAVVTFYKHDGSYYLTEQVHTILPWAGSIEISADEPEGRFVWRMSKEGFDVAQGGAKAGQLPLTLCDRNMATLILDNMTGPICLFANGGLIPLGVGKAVKLEGQWYYPIDGISFLTGTSDGASLGVGGFVRRIYYQNKDSGLLDIVRLIDAESDVFLMSRGYNYRRVEGAGVMVPTKIEIFRTDSEGGRAQRICQIDYQSILAEGI